MKMKIIIFLFYILYKISVSCLGSMTQTHFSWDIGQLMRFSTNKLSNTGESGKKVEKKGMSTVSEQMLKKGLKAKICQISHKSPVNASPNEKRGVTKLLADSIKLISKEGNMEVPLLE